MTFKRQQLGEPTRAFGLVAILSLTYLPSQCFAQCQYEVTIINGPNCFDGLSINDVGDICGIMSNCEPNDIAFRWSESSGVVALPMPPGTGDRDANCIANDGRICGSFRVGGDEATRAGFVLHNGVFTSLGTVRGGNWSEALEVNSSGQAVGGWGNIVTGTMTLAFRWENGEMFDMSPELGMPRSGATAINEAGLIVGWRGTNWLLPNRHGFLWEEGKITDLGPIPDGLSSLPTAINERGDVCGYGAFPMDDPEDIRPRAFYWSKGQMHELGILPSYEGSFAFDVNDAGVVVGSCAFGSTASTGVIWHDGVPTRLLDLVAPDSGVAFVSDANGINDEGQIVAHGAAFGEGVVLRLEPIFPALGDTNCDDIVDIDDLFAVVADWGPCQGCHTDFDQDQMITIDDLFAVLFGWGAK